MAYFTEKSWSEGAGAAKACEEAQLALSQIRGAAVIVSSSRPILDDSNDPPCIGAKHIYESIVENVGGKFLCTEENISQNGKVEPLEFNVKQGVSIIKSEVSAQTVIISAPAMRAG